MDNAAQLAALARTLSQLLVASYGLEPAGVAAEVRSACAHLGADDITVLLSDLDQRVLVAFDAGDERTFAIDDPGPGQAYRTEAMVESALADGRRQLWMPIKDSAERVGVLGIVDGGTVRPRHWEAVASLVGELVVSKSNYSDHIVRRRRRTTFTLAAEMRWALLPPLTFTSPDVAIAGFVQPTDRIAGDAFDYSVDGRVASVAIFDAMGHGLEASQMANVALGSYRTTRRAGADLVTSLTALDAAIRAQFGDSRYVTAQLATLALDTGRLEVVNAGHPLPLRLRAGEAPEVISCPVTVPAGLGCEPVVAVAELERGDHVLFRTDGLADARAPGGEFFGDARLADLVHRLGAEGLPPAEVLRRCLHATTAHQAGRPGDDATLLALHWADEARTAT